MSPDEMEALRTKLENMTNARAVEFDKLMQSQAKPVKPFMQMFYLNVDGAGEGIGICKTRKGDDIVGALREEVKGWVN